MRTQREPSESSNTLGSAATGHALATSGVLSILRKGGNAADAAVAGAFLLFTLMPEACGLGGDAFALVSTPADTVAINGSGRIPAHWRGDFPPSGAGLESVPGAVAALHDLHIRHGRLPWADLVDPAIRLASEGIPISNVLRDAIERRRGLLEKHATSWLALISDSQSNGLIKQPALARALHRIAIHGARDFYEGRLADGIIRGARAGGSTLASGDLACHESVIDLPVRVQVGDALIETSPPVSQACLVPFALSALPDQSTSGPRRTHMLTEAMEEAFQWRPLLSSREAIADLPWGWTAPGAPAQRRGGAHGTSHTTSLIVSDDEGTTVTALLSVFHEFGSGFFLPELGFFLNDRLLGLPDSRHPLATNRPVHTLSPVFVRQPAGRMGIATPGADAQVQVLAQILDSVLHVGLQWDQALAQPRWRLQGSELIVESDVDPALTRLLASMGHDIVTVRAKHHSMGAVTASGYRTLNAPVFNEQTFALADGRRDNNAASIN